jgi:hypothetical protein
MPLDKISFKKNYQVGQFLFKTITIKGYVNGTETLKDLLTDAEKTADEWIRQNNAQLQTDYFNGPEEPENIRPKEEKKILNDIKAGLAKIDGAAEANNWVTKHYPDYLSHFTVKTILKTKKIK